LQISGVDQRRAYAASGQNVQYLTAIVPREDYVRRMYGKEVYAFLDDPCVTIHPSPDPNLLYVQTRSGFYMLNPTLPFDVHADNYLQRAGIASDAQKTALTIMVKKLKGKNLWQTFKAFYPFLGGTAASHSHNLISSSYQITWNGTLTHSSLGVKGNGSTGYGNPAFNPTTAGLGLNSTHASCYINVGDTTNGCQFGAPSGLANAENFQFALFGVGGSNFKFFDCYGTNTGRISVAHAGNTGMYTGSRTAANASNLYKNGVVIGTTSGASETLLNSDLFLFARNQAGAGAFTDCRMAMMSFGLGLTSQQQADLYTIVQEYQTSLGRQV
jgi:hypothetical protein